MNFLRVPLFTLISHYLLPHLGFEIIHIKRQSCIRTSINITTPYFFVPVYRVFSVSSPLSGLFPPPPPPVEAVAAATSVHVFIH